MEGFLPIERESFFKVAIAVILNRYYVDYSSENIDIQILKQRHQFLTEKGFVSTVFIVSLSWFFSFLKYLFVPSRRINFFLSTFLPSLSTSKKRNYTHGRRIRSTI